MIPLIKKSAPKVIWTHKSQWMVDGRYWTAEGARTGMDMFPHRVVENVGRDVAEVRRSILDDEPRDVEGKLMPNSYGLRT